AYKDNVAFVKGPRLQQFAPARQDVPDFFRVEEFDSVISLKAETHNFPTTVEPFNGAATGSGGEIRDRLAGGKGSLPLAGTAVYMTAYSRLQADGTNNPREWEKAMSEREWLYQTPIDILIKASNGASDFGNKFGQPLIAGSVLTFEHDEAVSATADHRDTPPFSKTEGVWSPRIHGSVTVRLTAGGVGYWNGGLPLRDKPSRGVKNVIVGGHNYCRWMGGGAVSSSDSLALNSTTT